MGVGICEVVLVEGERFWVKGDWREFGWWERLQGVADRTVEGA